MLGLHLLNEGFCDISLFDRLVNQLLESMSWISKLVCIIYRPSEPRRSDCVAKASSRWITSAVIHECGAKGCLCSLWSLSEIELMKVVFAPYVELVTLNLIVVVKLVKHYIRLWRLAFGQFGVLWCIIPRFLNSRILWGLLHWISHIVIISKRRLEVSLWA